MSPPNTLEGWMAAVRAAERDGELLAAVDLAEQALADHPESVWLKHRAVLGLARAGSTTEAERRYADYRLGDVDDQDAHALAARIAKDRALAAVGSRREQLATESAELYRQIFDRDGGYYPGVNAATMTLVAGDAQAARALASSVLEELSRAEDRSYYAIVSEAEALLLLGRVGEARAALESAAALNDDDFGALSTTRRQLRMVCAETGQAEDVLAALAGPSVCHYCGHRIGTGPASRFPPDDEPSVAREIAFQVDRLAPGYGYGALANGADIMWAEALLARGAKLHVILPFATAEFIDASVADGGPSGSPASNAAWRPPSRSASRPMMRISVMTSCLGTAPIWPWDSPCSERGTWTRRWCNWRCGTASTTAARPARAPTLRSGDATDTKP